MNEISKILKVVFDVEGKDGPAVDLTNVLMKGTLIKAVLKCNGIWVANGKFGCTWRAEQIRAKVPEGGLREFAIESDSDDIHIFLNFNSKSSRCCFTRAAVGAIIRAQPLVLSSISAMTIQATAVLPAAVGKTSRVELDNATSTASN